MTPWWGVVLLVVACGKAETQQARQDNPGSSAPAIDAVATADPTKAAMPARGVAKSAIESAPRKDWPCRYVQTLEGLAA